MITLERPTEVGSNKRLSDLPRENIAMRITLSEDISRNIQDFLTPSKKTMKEWNNQVRNWLQQGKYMGTLHDTEAWRSLMLLHSILRVNHDGRIRKIQQELVFLKNIQQLIARTLTRWGPEIEPPAAWMDVEDYGPTTRLIMEIRKGLLGWPNICVSGLLLHNLTGQKENSIHPMGHNQMDEVKREQKRGEGIHGETGQP